MTWRIALVRHPTPDIAAGVCYGRLDIGLPPGAGDQIAAIVAALAGFAAAQIWTSPAARCRIAAAAIGAALQRPVVADPALLELDFGDWEGRAWDDVPRAALDRWAASPLSFAAPGGESVAALVARITRFHDRLHADEGDVVVVTHGGPLKILAALLRRRPVDVLAPAPPFASVQLIEATPPSP